MIVLYFSLFPLSGKGTMILFLTEAQEIGNYSYKSPNKRKCVLASSCLFVT